MAVQVYVRSKTGDTVYRPVYFAPDGRRRDDGKKWVVEAEAAKSRHKTARSNATAYANNQRVAVENGTWVDPTAEKPKARKCSWLIKQYRKTKPEGSSYWDHRAAGWTRLLGDKPIDLTQQQADTFIETRRTEGAGDSTIRKELGGASEMYEWAIVRGYARRNPFHRRAIGRPPKPQPNPCPYEEGEQVALLDYLDATYPDVRPVVEFCLETGIDRGEALTLNWNRHIKTDSKRLVVPRGKTGIGRTIPYGKTAAIKRILADAGKVRHTSGAVFLRDGKPIGAEYIKTAMRRTIDNVLPGHPKPWKSLRATYATRKAVREGVPIPQVAALMGVTAAHVLAHYVKPSGADLEEAMADQQGVVDLAGGTVAR